MKKMLTVALLFVLVFSITGCSDDKERLDKAATQAMEAQDDARTAVDEMNEDTKELEKEAQELELE